MKKNIYFITGGAGFIGSSLAEKLVASEQHVICLDNFDSFYQRQIKENNIKNLLQSPYFEFIEGDIRNKELLSQIFKNHQIELVIHLAAKAGVRPSIMNPNDYFDVNVNGTLTVLEAMKQYGVNKLIFASSSSIYGNSSVGASTETENVDFPISPYAATKKSGELLTHVYHHLFNLDVINLRLFTVYGPKQRPDLAIHKFFHKIYNHQPIDIYGDGSTSRDYTYIDDIVKGILGAGNYLKSNSNVYEIVNIGNNAPVSLKTLISLVEKVTQIKCLKNYLPMQQGDVNVTCANITKAQNLFGYNPNTLLEAGLVNFKTWYEKSF